MMNEKEIISFSQRVSSLIDNRRLRDAINEIKDLARKYHVFEAEDKIKATEQTYSYMLRYLTQGVKDPGRDDMYINIVTDIYSAHDMLINYLQSIDSPTLYYSNIRYNRLHPGRPGLARLKETYKEKADKLSLFSIVMSNKNEDARNNHKEMERAQNLIFTYIWTTPNLSGDDALSIKSIIDDSTVSAGVKQQIMSALTLGILQIYDKRKLQLLIESYMSDNEMNVTSAALVGMLLGLWKYSSRPLPTSLKNVLLAAKDTPTWSSDLRIAFIELIRARDTERINRKMREEVIPRMDKIRPDMIDKINKAQIDLEDPMSLHENPEWQDMLDKTGITDQLKELTEIQLEGGDVMMSTFAHLKNFNFFQDLPNWFLPFDPQHSAITDAMSQFGILGDLMENARYLCDSDKYSFMLAIESVPAQQRDLMVSQMKSQSEGLLEAMSNINTGTSSEQRRISVNSYMQNIYRFFKLFYRKNEFYDPFNRSLNLITVDSLSNDFDDPEMLTVVAEFYFKLKYMQEALDVYLHLESLIPGDVSRYQKIGYCYEMLGKYKEAIDFYERADLLDNNNAWTIKRLASAYRATGNKAAALELYRRLTMLLPDDMKAALLYGQSLFENGDYKEALHEFYRIEFMDEKSTRVLRPLAWTLFVTGDFTSAKSYYDRIITDKPTANDFLNLGHVYLAMGNMQEAVNQYSKSIQLQKGDKEWFINTLKADTDALRQAGIDKNVIPLIADATLYKE